MDDARDGERGTEALHKSYKCICRSGVSANSLRPPLDVLGEARRMWPVADRYDAFELLCHHKRPTCIAEVPIEVFRFE